MYIIIYNTQKYKIGFIKYLLKRLIYIYAYCVDDDKLKVLENYFNSDSCRIFDDSDLPVNIYKIIECILSNLVIVEYNNKYVIKVNPNAKYLDIKVDILNKIINNGNLQVKGYPLFKRISTHINNNIDKYLNKYITTGLI